MFALQVPSSDHPMCFQACNQLQPGQVPGLRDRQAATLSWSDKKENTKKEIKRTFFSFRKPSLLKLNFNFPPPVFQFL